MAVAGPPPHPRPHHAPPAPASTTDVAPPADDLNHWSNSAGDTYAVGSLQWPTPPPKDTSGRGVNRVDTDVLNTFANNMDALLPALDGCLKLLDKDKTQVPAGAFAQAYQLRTKVVGGDAKASDNSSPDVPVVEGTRAFLTSAKDALTALRDDTRKMALLYASTEDGNTADAKKLGSWLTDAGASVGQATGSPLAPGTGGTGTTGTTSA